VNETVPGFASPAHNTAMTLFEAWGAVPARDVVHPRFLLEHA
jgi:hypothetical protein